VRSALALTSVSLPACVRRSGPSAFGVRGRDDVAQIFTANDGARIDDAGQEEVAVLAVGGRQVGAEFLAVAEELMAVWHRAF